MEGLSEEMSFQTATQLNSSKDSINLQFLHAGNPHTYFPCSPFVSNRICRNIRILAASQIFLNYLQNDAKMCVPHFRSIFAMHLATPMVMQRRGMKPPMWLRN
jgi:hypothetical protein